MNDHIDVLATKPSKIVVVEGLIGAGKSLLIKIVQSEFAKSPGEYTQVLTYKEPIAPKMLDAYLKDQPKYALIFQHNILLKLLNIYRAAKAIALSQPGTLILIDRGIAGNRSFAKMQLDKGLFSETDYNLYLEEIGAFDGSLDAMISDPMFATVYLRCSPSVAFERMKRRGIKGEVECYTLEYFEALHKTHEEFLASPDVRVINWDEELGVDSAEVRALMARQILDVIQ